MEIAAARDMKNSLLIVLMRVLAVAAFGLGIVGIFVPGLPTVPFVILAAWAASKGWPAFEIWLLNHVRFGRYIREWREHRKVPKRAKIYASAMMLLSTLLLIGANINEWMLGGILLVMAGTLVWMWRH